MTGVEQNIWRYVDSCPPLIFMLICSRAYLLTSSHGFSVLRSFLFIEGGGQADDHSAHVLLFLSFHSAHVLLSLLFIQGGGQADVVHLGGRVRWVEQMEGVGGLRGWSGRVDEVEELLEGTTTTSMTRRQLPR
jgi:hypothetical protein